MPRYELRLRRIRDRSLQTITFDAPSLAHALEMIPRNTAADRPQLWCEGELLLTITRPSFEGDRFCTIRKAERLWVISLPTGARKVAQG